MNYKNLIILTFLFFLLIKVGAQNKLLIEHNNKSDKKKYIDIERVYNIKTNDTVYLNKKIINFTDTTISILTLTRTSKDTTHNYNKSNYSQDTTIIKLTDIQTLSKDLFKNTEKLEVFAWILVGAVLGVGLLPIMIYEEGVEGFFGWVIFEAVLIGISVPPLFIGTRKIKYDLVEKWTLKTE